MLSALSTIETDIINSTVLSYSEKSFPLAAVAIAKHSTLFHSQFFDVDGTSIVASSNQGKSQVIQKQSEQAGWKQVLEADAVGCAWGAVGGFIRGAVTGGLGGVLIGGPIGGIAGAANGAIIGSASGAAVGTIIGSGTKLVDLSRERES